MRYFLIIFSITLLISGCESGSEKSPEQIKADVEASQKKYAQERARIEAEKRKREAKLAEQRSYVSARFLSVDNDYLEVELTNETDKDIDNLSGSLEVQDAEGNYITSIGLTNWVPGDIYLPIGGKTLARKDLSGERPANKERLLSEAAGLVYLYTTIRIQFVGEDELNYMPLAPQAAKPKVVEPEPPVEVIYVNEANPEACTDNQITIETEAEYYPWPVCEHISRNLDSERFKLSYINMCKEELGMTEHLPSTARVQISMCKITNNGKGITYSKRICCDKP